MAAPRIGSITEAIEAANMSMDNGWGVMAGGAQLRAWGETHNGEGRADQEVTRLPLRLLE